jgi:hypothetical protein
MQTKEAHSFAGHKGNTHMIASANDERFQRYLKLHFHLDYWEWTQDRLDYERIEFEKVCARYKAPEETSFMFTLLECVYHKYTIAAFTGVIYGFILLVLCSQAVTHI